VNVIRRTIQRLGPARGALEDPTPLVRPFFVCGHPRSGTNWVSSLLNLHPRVFCDGEFHFHLIRSGIEGFQSQPWYVGSREPVRSETERAFASLVLGCLTAQAHRPAEHGGKPGATEVGDHTPRMLRMLIPPPAGRYIIIFRDGRDVLVSWTFHLLKTARPDIMHPQVRPIFEQVLPAAGESADAARQAARRLLADRAWVEHYAAGWSDHTGHDLATMRQLKADGHASSLLRLSYEELHADTQTHRARMYTFLGVKPSEASPLSRESHTAPGFGREAPRSFYRRGEVGDWRNYIDAQSHSWFLERAGARLSELGYDVAPAASTPKPLTPQSAQPTTVPPSREEKKTS